MYYPKRKLHSILLFAITFPLLRVTGSVFAGETLKGLEREISKLIDSSKVSVVTVASRFSQEVYIEKESGILSFFKTEVQKQAISYVNIGSGIILDDSGHILTRSSIVWGAESNIVTIANGKELSAEFVGHDPETGFAVIKQIDDENLKPAKLGNFDGITPGSLIVMIGNSLGVFPSIDFGVINGIRDDGMIQISTNLNPGNNGSPIFNLSGEVIGLVAGRLNVQHSMFEPVQGYNYTETTLAYPIDWIKKIAQDIIQFGYVRRGWLGVVGYHDTGKPKIRKIKENSPAQQAGLNEGDIIVKYSNIEVKSISELVHLVEYTPPGQTVAIEFNRSGEMLRAEIAIGERSIQNTYDLGFIPNNPTRNILLDKTSTSTIRGYPADLIERNKFLEMRINDLEKELNKLKKMIEH
ncbi:MAG: S1C family serine protease [bacterium]